MHAEFVVFFFMVRALYWRLALPEGFDVADLVDEVFCRLRPSPINPLHSLELVWEARPFVVLLFLPRPSINCRVWQMNERLLQVLGSEVNVSINGFIATHDRCAVRVLLPSAVPCDDENPFMALVLWGRTHWLVKYEFDWGAESFIPVQPSVEVTMVLELVTSLGPITDGTDKDRVKLMLGCVSRVDALFVQADLESWFQERWALGQWVFPVTNLCRWFPPGCFYNLMLNFCVRVGRASVFMMDYEPHLRSHLKFILHVVNCNMEVLGLLVENLTWRWRDDIWSANIFSAADISGSLCDCVSVIFSPCVGRSMFLKRCARWEREVRHNSIRRICFRQMDLADEIASFFEFFVRNLEVGVQVSISRMILCQLRRRQAPVYGISAIWRLVFDFLGFRPFSKLPGNRMS